MNSILRSLALALVIGAVPPMVAACGGAPAETGDEQNQTAASGKFETFEGADGKTYFQLLAGNGERVLKSQGYASLSAAKKGITSVKKNGGKETAYRVLEAKNGEHYFNLVAQNGEIVASSETYASKSNANKAVKGVIKLLANSSQSAAKTGEPRFETFEGQDGQHYFRLRAGNGEIVLQSEGYSSASKAEAGIESVKDNGDDGERYQILEGQDGQHYFRLTAGNSKVIGKSEMYISKDNATRGAETVRDIVIELAGGGGGGTDEEVREEIEAGAEGAIYVSESDEPFHYVFAELDSSDGSKITEELVREKLRKYVDDVEGVDQPMSELFAMTESFAEWKSSWVGCTDDEFPGPTECAELQDLDRALENNLTDIQVFYFGGDGEPGAVDGVAVTVFLIGRTPSGNLAGVRTVAIWT